MRTALRVMVLILSIMVMSACGNSDFNEQEQKDAKGDSPERIYEQTTADYFPLTENVKYTYEGEGNEYASYSVWVDYIANRRIQLRYNNGGTEIVKVLENKGGKLVLLSSKEECYYRENLLKESGLSDVLLQEPFEEGAQWTLADNRKRTISKLDAAIDTPSGNYKALEVTTTGEGYKTMDYYAPGVGLVQTVFVSDDGNTVTSTLSKIEKNTVLNQTVRFYYPNVKESKLYYADKTLSFETNAVTRSVFETAFKERPGKNLNQVLGGNVKINSLYLNADNMVYVDFSKELVSEMNAGSGYEQMILQSITNTLGSYYGVEKVYITVEGKPYESGHYQMKQGEAFSVNIEGSVKLP